MSASIRLLCVDDNELLAEALEANITKLPTFTWCGWINSTDSLPHSLGSPPPDIVLFDIDMPGRSVFDVITELLQVRPEIRVLMFSGYVRTDYLDRAIAAGAWGYASKNDRIEHLLDAVRRIAAGEFALTPEVETELRRSMSGQRLSSERLAM